MQGETGGPSRGRLGALLDWTALPHRLVGALLIVIACPLLWWGVQLAHIGGSFYYMLAGLGLAASGVLVVRGSAAGAWLYGAMLAFTIIWSLAEAGLRFWPLVPRLGVPLAIGLLVATPFVWRPLSGWPGNVLNSRQALMAIGGATVLSIVLGWACIEWSARFRSGPSIGLG